VVTVTVEARKVAMETAMAAEMEMETEMEMEMETATETETSHEPPRTTYRARAFGVRVESAVDGGMYSLRG
jgi:hypothetical protein